MRMAILSSAAIAVVMTACTSAVDPAPPAASPLAGRYEVSGASASGEPYAGEALITPRGDGYDVSWYLSQERKASGFGIQVGHVFGAVWSSNGYSLAGASVVAYEIAGGELTGIRLSGANPDGKTGREILKGSPNLAGRYDIVLSETPYGTTLHSGHVEIERHGNTFAVAWYTPDRSYVGSGVKIGDVLVVAYRREGSPGVIAYCIGNGILQGNWIDPGEAPEGQETLRRPGTGANGSAECP